MSTLKDLCSNIPQSLLREQANYNIMQRMNAAYSKRVNSLAGVRGVFEECRQGRPQKRKVQNRFSREQAGTCGYVLRDVRTSQNSVVVCKSRAY